MGGGGGGCVHTCKVSLKVPNIGDIANESNRLTSLDVVTNLHCRYRIIALIS